MPLDTAAPGMYLAQNETALHLLSGPGEYSHSFVWSAGTGLRFDVVQVVHGRATPLGWIEVGLGRADEPRLNVLATWSRGQIEVRLRNTDSGSQAQMSAMCLT